MIGAPTFIARSMTLQIFSAYASDSDPPKTVKSWLKTKTSRPSMVPWPVTTPSPRYAVSTSGFAIRDERIEFDERAGVEQELQAFARRQLSARVLLIDAFLSAPESRLVAHRVESRQSLLIRRQRPRPPENGLSLRTDSRHHTVPVIHRNGEQLAMRVDNRVPAMTSAGVAWRLSPAAHHRRGPLDSR